MVNKKIVFESTETETRFLKFQELTLREVQLLPDFAAV